MTRYLKAVIIAIAMMLSVSGLSAQPLGNEWIRPGQQYLKITVTDNSVYRFTYSALANSGFPVSSIDPRKIQVFHKGKEVAIHVAGENDGVFNQGDYVEFIGRATTGSDDPLYDKPSSNTNPWFNQQFRIGYYYLTYAPDQAGKRMQQVAEKGTQLTPEVSSEQEMIFFEDLRVVHGPVFPTYFVTNIDKGALLSNYVEGKGIIGRPYTPASGKVSTSVVLKGAKQENNKVRIELRFTGRLNSPHNIDLFVGTHPDSLTKPVANIRFSNYQVRSIAATLDGVKFSSKNPVLYYAFRVNAVASSNEEVALAATRVVYDRDFDMQKATSNTFGLRANLAGSSRMELSNVLPGTRFYDVTDEDNIKMLIPSDSTGDKRTVIVPNFFQARKVLAQSVTNVYTNSGTNIVPMDFKPLPEQYDYIILSHSRLMKEAGGFPNAVQAYADYRTSAQGGNYKVSVIDVDQLFEHFSYGEPNMLAIRRFVEYAFRKGSPRFLFIIGKGLTLNYFYYVVLPFSLNWNLKNNVPTYGYPGSDNQYSAGLGGMPSFVPGLATGRLSANTPEDVINYLNKTKDHESGTGSEEWRKNILHLSGGKTVTENTNFKRYMDGFKAIAEGDYLGAKVMTSSKRTTETVEYINISDQLNKGVAVVNFFGHAAVGVIDIEIGRVSDESKGYRNKGKYPMIIVNGCESGDIFRREVSSGEDWILTKDKGAILFLAHDHWGFEHTLRSYTEQFYRVAFGDKDFVNKPVGMVLQETAKRFLRQFGNDELSIANVQQFILQGDPAIRLFNMPYPDYQIGNNTLFAQPIDNTKLTAQADSFRIGIAVSNLGIVDRTPLTIGIRRTYNDGSSEMLETRSFRYVRNTDTLYYTVENTKENRDKIYGMNKFEVFVDYEGKVVESREDNNQGMLNVFLPRATMITLAPREYSIVSRQPVRLIAQNTDLLTKERAYRFEMDTSYLFNSVSKKQAVVNDFVTAQWLTSLLKDHSVTDTTVYYWRVRYNDLLPEDDTTWAESSFVYIKDSPAGWSQSAMPQFRKASLNNVEQDMAKRQWNFTKKISRIRVQAAGGNGTNRDNYFIRINDDFIAGPTTCYNRDFDGGYGDNVLILVTIDRATGNIINNFAGTDDSYGNGSCGSSLLATMMHHLEASRARLLERYIAQVKPGDYVVMINGHYINYEGWSDLMVNALGTLGVQTSTFKSRVKNHSGYILIGQKGAPIGSAREFFADPSKGDVTQQVVSPPGGEVILTHAPTNGTITSSLIGPARSWGNVFRNFSPADDAKETWKLDVVGVDRSGSETTLFSDVKKDAFDLGSVNAGTYPYLKLRVAVRDSMKGTPYPLKRWQVIYQEVPEGIALYETSSYRENSLLQVIEGDTARIKFNFYNISGTNFEPNLPVQYFVTNTAGQNVTLYDTIRPAVRAGATIQFTAKVNSLDFKGDNKMTVFINPRIQAEQIYENNIVEAKFKVVPDNINPVLDVAFDGKHIMNGDIVAPAPLITVSLKDENKYLIKRDTAGMEIMIRECDSCSYRRINLNDPAVSWATDSNNRMSIEYKPGKLKNGTYTLLVQGTDVTGNKSGIKPYEVSFRVINENTVTNFYPYPNPFSTSMRFVFTLTGEIPEDIRIRIMTISGKVVRVINKEELGVLKIGTNVTEFAWDGTDEFGDKLANGVYLYKVDVRKDSKAYEHSETAADNLFKHGYGKIYLLR